MIWKVFTTERGFDDLFWDYWDNFGENGDNPRIAKEQGKRSSMGKLDSDATKDEREQLAAFASDEEYGKRAANKCLLRGSATACRLTDFLALAKFRREQRQARGKSQAEAETEDRRTTVKRQGWGTEPQDS